MTTKMYNQEKHIGDMPNMNQYECENSNKSIWLPSLIIWLDMKQTSPISRPEMFKNLRRDGEHLNTYKNCFLPTQTRDFVFAYN